MINALIILSDEKRRKIVYAIDEGKRTLEEISTSTSIGKRILENELRIMSCGGILERRIRKKGDDFEDYYTMTSYCESLLKCLCISLSREDVEKACKILEKEKK